MLLDRLVLVLIANRGVRKAYRAVGAGAASSAAASVRSRASAVTHVDSWYWYWFYCRVVKKFSGDEVILVVEYG